MNMRFSKKQVAQMTIQQSLGERLDLISIFQDNWKTKYSFRLKIIFKIITLMATRKNLTRA